MKCRKELLAGSNTSYWPMNHHTRATLGPWVQYTDIMKHFTHTHTHTHKITHLSFAHTHRQTIQKAWCYGLLISSRQHDLLVWHGLGQGVFSRKLTFFRSWSFFKERTPAGPLSFGDINKSSCHVLQPGSGRHTSPLTWHQVNWRTSPSSSFCKGSSPSHSCQWHITLVGTRVV